MSLACNQAAIDPSNSASADPSDAESNSEEETVSLWAFSRCPESFRQALQSCSELTACQQLLRDSECAPELPSGVKLFVHPYHYAAVVQAVAGRDLRASHIIVAQEFERFVTQAIEGLPKRYKVYFRSSEALSLPPEEPDVASSTENLPVDMCIPVNIVRTFIHLDVPSSLYSKSCGPKTVSTTQAREKNRNPRCL